MIVSPSIMDQMFNPHDRFDTPPDDTLVWRYMNIDKFLALVCSKKLHLTRLDHFKDPFEGRFPPSVLRAWAADRPNRPGRQPLADALRKSFFVNCWHESDVESAALWEQYSSAGGIAVRSTIARLKNADQSDLAYSIGRVQYVDFDKYEWNKDLTMLTIPCLKRRSFRHEEEVRIVAMDQALDMPSKEKSLSIDGCLGKIAESVWLSPLCPKWLTDHVITLMKEFGLGFIEVKRSDLYEDYLA